MQSCCAISPLQQDDFNANLSMKEQVPYLIILTVITQCTLASQE